MDQKQLVTFAQYAEKCERFEDMADAMNKLTRMKSENAEQLENEERNLLSVAYKNVVGARRSAWRMISAIENKEKEEKDNTSLAKDFRLKIEAELSKICEEVLSLLDTCLIPNATVADSQVFYLKMKGDYFRYEAEYCSGDAEQKAKDNAESAYNQAYELAKQEMLSTHPNRLGLALNFSVFHYEIQKCPDKACHLAKAAFDDAIEHLDKLDTNSYKDSTLIMQLLRDNLTLWTTDAQQEEQVAE